MANTISRLSDETINRIIQIESAGNPNAKARTSSAAGLGQFINATWLKTVEKHKPQLFKEYTRDQVARMRVGSDTAALQLEMLARFTEDNAAALGPGCTDGDLYLAHFLGIGDARKLFKADPNSLASYHVTPKAVEANKSILAGKRCVEVRVWAQASMEQRWVKAGKPDWVRKYAGQPVLPRMPPDIEVAERPVVVPADAPAPIPPDRPKVKAAHVGFFGVIAAAWIALTNYVQAHPFIIGGGVFLALLAIVVFVIMRRKG